MAVLTVLVWAGERRVHQAALDQARRDVADRLDAYERALSSAMFRRASILYGARSWLQLDGEGWQEHFAAFAPGLASGIRGVRAVQVVEDGIIRRTWPLEGNEAALGLDLKNHPQPRIPADLWRAHDSGALVVSDPVELVQGGMGIILRLASGPPGDRVAPSAAAVLDLAPVLAEAGLPASGTAGLRMYLKDGEGRIFFGEPTSDSSLPVRRAVVLPDGAWEIGAVPLVGWAGAVGRLHRGMVGAGVLLVLLSGIITWLTVGRQARLESAVRTRTAELELAMRQLKESRAFVDAALRAGRVYAWAWEPGTDRVVRSGGLAEFLGRPEMDDVLADVRDMVHPDDLPRLVAVQEEAVQSGSLSIEYRIVCPGGRTVWVRDEGRLLVSESGRRRLVGAMADVTRVKELEQQLLHAQRMEEVGRLAAVVAHDFNNLLTVMQANLELALEEVDDHVVDDLAQVAQAIEHATFLTRQLLSFSRRDVVSPERLEFDKVVYEAVDLVRPILGSSAVIDLELGAPDARIHMDRGQLTQIIFNLTVNARDAMPGGGRVRVATRLQEQASQDGDGWSDVSCCLEVEDEGSGIPEDALRTIFQPFVTTKGPDKGTGLGLSTVQTIVDGVGGRIDVENRVEGGARFAVHIPGRTDRERAVAVQALP